MAWDWFGVAINLGLAIMALTGSVSNWINALAWLTLAAFALQRALA